MKSPLALISGRQATWRVIGALVPLLAWITVKYGLAVSDRYLPSPLAVLTAAKDIEPSIVLQSGATLLRLLEGGLAGLIIGLGGAIILYNRPTAYRLLMPTVQGLRSIPSVATVPFFLLWFGFEEIGKFLLISLGVGLNIFIAAYQVLEDAPERFLIAMRGFGRSMSSYPLTVLLPLVLERILPTLRTSLSIAFGVVVVAELLGSQVGLGYLIQTSRTTYSIHVIFLATLILGILNTGVDRLLVGLWGHLIYWTRNSERNRP